MLTAQPEQDSRIHFAEFRAALTKLPNDQREVIMLIGAAGLSYDEAAAICQCPAGTIKSRTNRGRLRLAKLMSIDTTDNLGPDRAMQAALTGGNLHWAA